MVHDTTVALSEPLTTLPLSSLFPLQVARYIVVACLTLCVWDWLLALSDEFEMIRHGGRCRRYILDILYLVVRICPIVYLVAVIHLAEGTIDTTKVLMRILSATNMMIMPANSALFFIRVRAVYSRNKYVTGFFGSCWLVILGFFIFDSISGMMRCSDIGPSTRCFVLQHSDAWGYIATAVYDTLMYLSISWRLASFTPADRWQDRLKSFVTGNGLGSLSKALLQSGQMYYCFTIGLSVCSIVLAYSPSVHTEWNGVCVPPNVTVASIMACRLVRELKLGLFVGPMTDGAISQIVFRDITTIPQRDTLGLYTFDDAGVDIGTDGKRDVLADESRSEVDIELEEIGSRTCG